MIIKCFKLTIYALLFCSLNLILNFNAKSELRLSLEKKEFNQLKTFFPPSFNERFDIYIEAFNGKEFLFEKKGLKFRLKNSKKKTIVQVTKKIENQSFKCDSKTFSWEKNKVYESKNKELIRLLLFKGFEMFKYLQSNQIIPLYLALDFDFQIRSLKFEGKKELLSSVKNEGHVIFIPSHTNKKIRLKKKINLKNGKKLKFFLGKTIDQGPENNLETTYKIEAEGPNTDMEKEKNSLDTFCRILKRIKTPNEGDDLEKKPREKDINLKLYIKKMPSFIFKKK